MQLKSLQIQGFKSFPDKTTLEFGKGLTCVVGPNGSGKSNISDAVRWVLGEQSTKNLRGEKMEDVIFLGTQNRKATGFALVALTIDNTDRQLLLDADDVTISRRLYRSGESEYRINQTAVRLKDVNEMFMDTGLGRDGYSMIGQGKIEEIVSAKSTQRREIFEEAAGISKYRYRKGEAEKRLEAAYENLLRLKDIMAELESRVAPLREQAKKAEQFLVMATEKKTLEVSLWMETIRCSHKLILEQEEQLILARNKCRDLQSVLDEYQYSLDEGYQEIQKCSVEVEERRRAIANMKTELAQCDADVAVLNNNLSHHSDTMKELQEDVVRYTQGEEGTQKQLAKNTAAAEEKQKLLEDLIRQKEEQEKHSGELTIQQEQIQQEITQLKSKRADYEQNIGLQKLNKASSVSLQEEMEHRLQSLEQFQDSRDGSVKAAGQELRHCEELIADIKQHLQTLENTHSAYLLKKQSKENALHILETQHKAFLENRNQADQKARILSDLERSMDGYYNSVKHVLSAVKHGRLEGIDGTVSQLISTKKSDYSVAIETALGSALQQIVVENEQAAKAAIANLKFAKAGRATFLPRNVIKPQNFSYPTPNDLKSEEGFIGIASQLVSCDEKYNGIIGNLLGRVVVTEDIDTAVALAKKYDYKFRVVTLDGQLVNAGGSLTGGSTVKNTGILSRKDEIKQLIRQSEKLLLQANELEPSMQKERQTSAELTAQILSVDSEIKTAQEDKITYTAECKRLQLAFEETVKSHEEMMRDYSKMKEKLETLQATSITANDTIAAITAELEKSQEEIESKKNQSELLTQEKEMLSEHINNIRFSLLAVTKDRETLTATTAQLHAVHEEQELQVTQRLEKLQSLKEDSKGFHNQIQQKLSRKKQLMGLVNKENFTIEETIHRRTILEQKLSQLRVQEKEHITEKERATSQLSRVEDKKITLQMEYDKIIARLWDEYGLTRSQGDALAVTVDDEVNMKNRLAQLKSNIRNLGSVNVSAIEEYKEIFDRYSFMKKQMDDVENSRNQLINLIRELTTQMRKLFSESFQNINEHFKLVFQELFSGGHGELVLTDPQNILESGIEINVQPPGKIIKNLSSLSGGEKAFVAIGIYFAILQVRPAPFCMLDEIEAALDEVNVTRYAQYLKKLCDKTQFIAITHRRGTMEESDVMYGVTMPEKGVSKLLTLNISGGDTLT